MGYWTGNKQAAQMSSGGRHAEGQQRRVENRFPRAQVPGNQRVPDLMEGKSSHRGWVEEKEDTALER
jgi:hypothetical protein